MKHTSRLIFVAFTVFLQAFPALGAAHNRLDHLQQEIQSVKNRLSSDHQRRDVLNSQLARTETASGRLTQQLGTLRQQLSAQKTWLNKLITQQQAYERQRDTLRALLLRQIKAAYMLGNQPFIKMLLNEDNPNRITQLLTYYDYLNQDRVQDIVALNETLAHLSKSKEKVAQQYTVLQALNSALSKKERSLALTRCERTQLIQRLNQRIQSRREQLSELRKNKATLEQAITHLHRQEQTRNPGTALEPGSSSFARLKGRLHWPTRGRINQYYGTQMAQSTLRWKGVLLKAPQDQPVYAVANGRVVFSKWLPGYGLLLIVDHGEGYMTLYGRNHILYKAVGDNVQAGERIASVGKSGGYKQSGLYFAIRHNAKAMNPSRWCH